MKNEFANAAEGAMDAPTKPARRPRVSKIQKFIAGMNQESADYEAMYEF